jgi:hypothetical protein
MNCPRFARNDGFKDF